MVTTWLSGQLYLRKKNCTLSNYSQEMADKDCSKDKYETLVRSVKRYMQHPANWHDEMMTNICTYMDYEGNSKNGDKGINVMMSLAD